MVFFISSAISRNVAPFCLRPRVKDREEPLFILGVCCASASYARRFTLFRTTAFLETFPETTTAHFVGVPAFPKTIVMEKYFPFLRAPERAWLWNSALEILLFVGALYGEFFPPFSSPLADGISPCGRFLSHKKTVRFLSFAPFWLVCF